MTIDLYLKFKGALEGQHAFVVKQQLKGSVLLKSLEAYKENTVKQ
ncbi:hypothetical protein JCM19238_4840 [Vibrio ponticus]|nr:hypothetical protein JCM19238_4840 [Vibrio ponticus]